MIALLRFLAVNAWLFSLMCWLSAVYFAWRARSMRQAGAITPYSLEREGLTDRVNRTWATAGVLSLVGVLALLASPVILSRTADTATRSLLTPVAGILTRTPTVSPSPTPLTPSPTFTPTPEVSATPSPPPTRLVEETASATPEPVLVSRACSDPHVQLGAPTAGQSLTGVVEIRGVATIPDFAFYKFEISGPLTGGEWWTVGDLFYAPVDGGLLGYWDATPIAHQAPGLYSFRLVVVDSTGNYPPPCVVQVRIAPE
ncbi:MAG: hypothetical protein JW850_16875 [Thermoflexales bacterium]|nr:hypothetical protein [Thermoflexales bacterium]